MSFLANSNWLRRRLCPIAWPRVGGKNYYTNRVGTSGLSVPERTWTRPGMSRAKPGRRTLKRDHQWNSRDRGLETKKEDETKRRLRGRSVLSSCIIRACCRVFAGSAALLNENAETFLFTSGISLDEETEKRARGKEKKNKTMDIIWNTLQYSHVFYCTTLYANTSLCHYAFVRSVSLSSPQENQKEVFLHLFIWFSLDSTLYNSPLYSS